MSVKDFDWIDPEKVKLNTALFFKEGIDRAVAKRNAKKKPGQ